MSSKSDLDNLSKQEHEAWKYLCQLLLESGAVYQDDLDSPCGRNYNTTKGQKILNQIRRWGNLASNLDDAENKMRPII